MEERAEDSRERELQARILEREELRGIMDEALEVHGHRPGKKQEGVIRVMYENANGIDGKFTKKLEGRESKGTA